jgi:hypothetical protein
MCYHKGLITTIFCRMYVRTYYAHPRARVISFSECERRRRLQLAANASPGSIWKNTELEIQEHIPQRGCSQRRYSPRRQEVCRNAVHPPNTSAFRSLQQVCASKYCPKKQPQHPARARLCCTALCPSGTRMLPVECHMLDSCAAAFILATRWCTLRNLCVSASAAQAAADGTCARSLTALQQR